MNSFERPSSAWFEWNPHKELAKFSTFELLEKFLVWTWANNIRSALNMQRIGRNLYSLGFNSDVNVAQLREGIFELTSAVGIGVLSAVSARIFSHLMARPIDEIDDMVRDGF